MEVGRCGTRRQPPGRCSPPAHTLLRLVEETRRHGAAVGYGLSQETDGGVREEVAGLGYWEVGRRLTEGGSQGRG